MSHPSPVAAPTKLALGGEPTVTSLVSVTEGLPGLAPACVVDTIGAEITPLRMHSARKRDRVLNGMRASPSTPTCTTYMESVGSAKSCVSVRAAPGLSILRYPSGAWAQMSLGAVMPPPVIVSVQPLPVITC